jgi:uncharacterized protein (UPF0335 family)
MSQALLQEVRTLRERLEALIQRVERLESGVSPETLAELHRKVAALAPRKPGRPPKHG